MLSSLDIYNFLKEKNLLQNSPKFWWPDAGDFVVVVSAILAQNTRWENVEKSLKNLDGFLEFEKFLTLKEDSLKKFIKPSGFYNQKAPRLLQLVANIRDEFKTFENFKKSVSREWLLYQKGIGQESADAILCYCCFRDEMIVDSYTKRLLKSFDIEFKTYKEYKIFLEKDIKEEFAEELYNEIFIKFHGMIVEYNKLKPFK